jgi:hypothetical protein
MISFNGFSFEGPYNNTAFLQHASGVYLILDNRSSELYTVDCGESGDVRNRVEGHDRKACWHRHSTGDLVVAVHYAGELARMAVERAIRNSHSFPCGIH